MGKIIEVGGETWKVSALGAQHEGKVYAHLVHTTKGRQTRYRPPRSDREVTAPGVLATLSADQPT